MKAIIFPLEKLAIVFFCFELMFELEKTAYAAFSISLMILSLKFEGARVYTPMIFMIIFLEFFDMLIAKIILLIIVGIAFFAFRVYDISTPIKGPYMMGQKYKKLQTERGTLLLSIFYPTLKKGKKVEWIPSKSYSTILYDIFHVDPSTKRLPILIFNFVVSYIHKIYLPAEGESPYVSDQDKMMNSQAFSEFDQNKEKIIVFSHGLGAHCNAYSSFFASWVGEGYTVVSVYHEHDTIRIDHREETTINDYQNIKDYLWVRRNKDLVRRVEEMSKAIEIVVQPNFMKELFGIDQEIKEVILGGHSFGATTTLATKSFINEKENKNFQKFISKMICFDPWYFPFTKSTYDNLKNESAVIINSEYFYTVVPFIYDLETKHFRLKKNNPDFKDFIIKKLDHIAQSDMAYVFGNILQITGSIKLHHQTDNIMSLNILISKLYLKDFSREHILEETKRFVNENQMEKDHICVLDEYRTARHLTFGKQLGEVQTFVDQNEI